MVVKTLFVEGTTDDTNGDLRKGFRLLLEKKMKTRMPTIITSNDTACVIRKFKVSNDSFALIDILYQLTKKTQKSGYHKVKHGSDLLMRIDIEKLIKDFPDFDNLIMRLLQL